MTAKIQAQHPTKEKIFTTLQGQGYRPVTAVILHSAGITIIPQEGQAAAPWWTEDAAQGPAHSIESEWLYNLTAYLCDSLGIGRRIEPEQDFPGERFPGQRQDFPIVKKMYDASYGSSPQAVWGRIDRAGLLHLVAFFDDDASALFHSTHSGNFDIAWQSPEEAQ